MHDDPAGLTPITGQAVSNASADFLVLARVRGSNHAQFHGCKTHGQAPATGPGRARYRALSHSDCLELVARQFGVANWNILSARIDAVTSAGSMSCPKGWISAPARARLLSRRYWIAALGAAWIESKPELADPSATTISAPSCSPSMPTPFRGQRIRLSQQPVTAAAGRWRRDHLVPRRWSAAARCALKTSSATAPAVPLTGNTDWTERQIVLDVPDEATTLNYGFYVKGKGRGLGARLRARGGRTATAPPSYAGRNGACRSPPILASSTPR